MPYAEAGPRLKRKLAADVAVNNLNVTKLLIHAATVSTKKSNNSNIAFVLENYNSSKSKASEEPIPLTINNALEFLLENSLTKRLYNEIPNA